MNLIQINPQYQKNLLLPPGQGYSVRKTAEPYRSLVVHTTNGKAGTKFENEVKFLATSKNVSAHYIISKAGVIQQILDPANYAAWHAGEVVKEQYSNLYAIGVEVHFTAAELYWTGKMWGALTNLCRINSTLELVTHRQIAVPKGRKIDPSGVSDLQFTSWRLDYKKPHQYGVLKVNTNVRQSPHINATNITAVYPKNLEVVINAAPIEGDSYNGSSLWYYCNWLGYIHASLVSVGGEV
jgi:N-acetyl-anhydromuramyl-L-alanine amidase AmpD